MSDLIERLRNCRKDYSVDTMIRHEAAAKIEQLEADFNDMRLLARDRGEKLAEHWKSIERVKALPDQWRKAFDYESESGEPLDAIKRGVNKCSDDLVASLEEQEYE